MIPKFNPSFLSDREAIDGFVVRRFEFEQIVDSLATAIEGEPPKFLVSAPRGAGKSTLCRRVVAEVRTRDALSAHWQPIFLGEESYSVTTPGEFLLEVLFQLNDQLPEALLHADLAYARNASDENELIGRTLTTLQNCAAAIDKRFLVVVENFHVILADQMQGDGVFGRGLLDLIDRENIFAILATSVAQAIDGIEDELNGYASIELKPLSLNECRALWLSLTHDDAPGDKIRPIQILTGGSPRLLHILADFMRTRSLRDLMENLNFLIDQNTEYFKSQLDALPVIERKVFAALLEIWDPSSAKQVAEVARVNTNIASAMLARLADRGAVIKEPGQGRSAIYFAAERLFNIYYLMRRRNHPSSRVKALVTFMVEFYSREELVDTTALLVREACDVDPSNRGDYHSTFDAILARSSDSVRDEILRSTPTEFIRSFRQDQKLSRQASYLSESTEMTDTENVLDDLIGRMEAAADDGDIVLARDLIQQALEVDGSMTELWMRLAFVQGELNDPAAAIEAARRATELDPSDAWTHTVLGLSLRSNERPDEAIGAYRAALELDPGHEPALVAAAGILEGKDDRVGAIALYQSADEAGELTDLSRALYAQLLSRMERADDAEALLREGADELENHLTRHALSDFLRERDRIDEADKWYEDFAERSDQWEAFADLGSYFLHEAENAPAARDALRTAVKMGATDPLIFYRLARALFVSGSTTDEVASVAVDLVARFPIDGSAWIYAGRIYEKIDALAEAEAAYRAAIEREDGRFAFTPLARLLEADPSRHNEVEALLHSAISNAEGRRKCAPMRQLAEFLIHKGEDDAAAEVLQQAVSANDRCACCYVLQGDLCRRNGDLNNAEEQYRSALAVYGKDVGALTGLAHIVDQAEARALIETALKSESNDPRAALASLQLDASGPPLRLEVARLLVQDHPEFLEARLFLVGAASQEGLVVEALDNLKVALSEISGRRDAIPLFVRAAMSVVKAGEATEVAELLKAHKNGDALEPLAVAVQLARGETPLVAKEVMEVARDIVLRS